MIAARGATLRANYGSCAWRSKQAEIGADEALVHPRSLRGAKRRPVRRSSMSEGGSNPCLSKRIDGLLRCARNDAERAGATNWRDGQYFSLPERKFGL